MRSFLWAAILAAALAVAQAARPEAALHLAAAFDEQCGAGENCSPLVNVTLYGEALCPYTCGSCEGLLPLPLRHAAPARRPAPSGPQRCAAACLPRSAAFITQTLAPLLPPGGRPYITFWGIIKFQYVAWGNAKVKPNVRCCGGGGRCYCGIV